jgi:hypothetical protein
MIGTSYILSKVRLIKPATGLILVFILIYCSSCKTGAGIAGNSCAPIERAYASLLKERDSLLIENKQLKQDNRLLGKTLTDKMVEQDITPDE